MLNRIGRYLILILVLMPISALKAQEDSKLPFTFIEWDRLTADTLMPIYSETIPLESDYRVCSYSVELLYPQYEGLTDREHSLMKRYAERIGQDIDVEYSVTTSRGRGMMNVSFLPVVKRNGRMMKLTSFKMVITPHQQQARAKVPSTTKRYASNSVLRQGTWRKISITQDGMYRLTESFLRGLGFQDPAKVHLYGYGGHEQSTRIDADNDWDDLEEVPLYKAPDGSLLFWGNGLLTWTDNTRTYNAYANKAYYFLTQGEERANITTQDSYAGTVPQSNTDSTTIGHALHEVDNFAWRNYGRNLYDGFDFSTGYASSYFFNNIRSIGNEKLTTVFTHGSRTSALQYVVTVNGNKWKTRNIGRITDDYKFAAIDTKTEDVSALAPQQGTSWTVSLNSTPGIEAHLDYIALHYTRQLKTQNGFVDFQNTRDASRRFVNIGNGDGTTDPVVMKIGKRGTPACLIQTVKDDGGLSFAVSAGPDRFVAFDPTYAFPTPTAEAGIVPNQDLHAMDSLNLDMVIIIPASGKLKAQAERLAQLHRDNDGMNVAVVNAGDIYNEFSSGTPDVTAYRRFLKMLYDQSDKTSAHSLKYVLMFGPCLWDNRLLSTHVSGLRQEDYLLCYESDNSVSMTDSYVMEDYHGLMDDGKGSNLYREAPDLGIGRIPAKTEAQAKIVVDKTIAFVTNANAGDWRNRITIIGDDGDNTSHMDYANRIADTTMVNFPRLEVSKFYFDNYKRESDATSNTFPEAQAEIVRRIKEGVLLFNYTGHADATKLSHERVVTLDEIVTRTDNPGMWFTAACDVMPMDGPEDNLGVNSMLQEGGGSLAFLGTTRTVYAQQNYNLNHYFMKNLFASVNGRRNRIGDAHRLAKVALASSSSINKLQYCLLGDPAIVLGNPVNTIVLDSINGTAPGKSAEIKAGSVVTIKGHVQDGDGTVMTDMDGLMSTRLFDTESTVYTKNNANDGIFEYLDRQNTLYSGSVPVKGGMFVSTFVVGKDINYADKSGRFVFYAFDDEHNIQATGYNESFNVGGISTELEGDTLGPRMFIYLNGEEFVDGGVVPASPVFGAKLQDPSGINTSGNGIGHDLTLIIDDMPSMTYNLNDNFVQDQDDYTSGLVSFSIPELPQGLHTLSFRAWDMLNNTSEQRLNFVIDNTIEQEPLQISVAHGLTGSSNTMQVVYNLGAPDGTLQLEVYHLDGKRVVSYPFSVSDPSGVVMLPLSTITNGGSLVSGIYAAHVHARTAQGKNVSSTVKFIVQNNKR